MFTVTYIYSLGAIIVQYCGVGAVAAMAAALFGISKVQDRYTLIEQLAFILSHML